MNDGCTRCTVAVLFGAVLLTVVALSTAAGQGSGQKGGGGMGASTSGMGVSTDQSQNQNQAPPPTNNSDIAKAKADRQQNIQDAARLAQLAAEVKQELENGSQLTLSVASLKKTDEMEKLSKKPHARMKADNAAVFNPPPVVDASKGRD